MKEINTGQVKFLKEKKAQLKIEYDKIVREYADTCNKLAEVSCPYEVGDTIEYMRRNGSTKEGIVQGSRPPELDFKRTYDIIVCAKNVNGTISKIAEYITEEQVL